MIASLVSFVSRMSKRQKAAFYGALIVASFLVLHHLMLRPILAKMGELDKKIVETEESIEKALGILAQEENLLERADRYASYLKKPDSDDKEKLSLQYYIQDLASQSSVEPKDIKSDVKSAVEEGTGSESVKKYVVRLTCEGEMEELVSFFYDIEASKEKLLKIETFSMILKKKGENVIICTMEITRDVIL